MAQQEPDGAPDSIRGAKPGAIGFHGDAYLLRLVAHLAQRSEVFVETGTNLGTTLGFVARTFPALRCLSCEPDRAAFEVARRYVADHPQVAISNETSQDFMARLAAIGDELFKSSTLFWLDAHGYGFDWPLREELHFIGERFDQGFVLIDDFVVPGRPEFGFDQYEEHICSWEYVRESLSVDWRYRLYYPAYTEHTSSFHPLRGWGLIQFGRGPLGRLDLEPDLAGVLELAESSGKSRRAATGAATGLQATPAVAKVAEDRMASPKRAARAPGSSGCDVSRDRFDDLRALIPREDPVVVDGGANRGAVVEEVLARWPGARVHAVEAQPQVARELAARYSADPRVTVHAAALAAQSGQLELHVTANSVSSSALPPSSFKQSLQGAKVETVETITVPARRLADLVREPIDLLKLDLQGYEVEALRGLGPRLAEVGAVLTELQFAPLYEGTPLFGDVDRVLREAGFGLFNLYELWTSGDGQLTAGDGIWLNGRVFELPDSRA